MLQFVSWIAIQIAFSYVIVVEILTLNGKTGHHKGISYVFEIMQVVLDFKRKGPQKLMSPLKFLMGPVDHLTFTAGIGTMNYSHIRAYAHV